MNFRTLLPAFVALGALTVEPVALHAQVAPPPGAQASTAPVVRSIDVQYAGATTVSKEKLIANMRTRVGKPYSEQAVEEDIRNLYKTGNISNVRIFGEPTADGVKVIVVVQSKAKITEVRLTGVTRLKEGRIRKEISAKPGDTLDEAGLEQDRQKILKYYSDKGFTEVDVKYTSEINETLGTASVSFTVNEGGKLFIRSVKFEGNAVFTRKDLAKVVKTKPKTIISFLSGGGKLNTDQLDTDVVALRDKYTSQGYMDANIAPPRIDRDGEKVDVTFVIREGSQYKVGKVTYNGAKVFPIEDLTRTAQIKPGNVYSPQGVRADVKTIQDVYGTRGYVDVQAGANTTPGPGNTIDVTFNLDEGVQSYVEHINISGNQRTKDKVIRRELPLLPGDVFNTVRVDAGKARLMNTKYFSKVETYPADTLVPGRKDLNVIVEEQRTGSFNFGAGFSSIDNLLGFAEITQGNFDVTRWPYFTGGGQKFRLRAQYGTRRKDFILSLTEPYFMDREIAVGGELYYREASFTSSVYSERRYGFDVTARKRLQQFLAGSLGYRLEDITIFNVDANASDTIRAEQGTRLKSEIFGGLNYDTRDSLFLTRRGERISLNANVAGGFLGGDTDIYGFDLEASKYLLLPWDTILTLNGEVATVATWAGGDRVPIFDRLYLGGANNLRGFKFRDVGPKDENGEAIGGNTLARFTIEYTFPVIDKIRGAVFYDVGFVNAGDYDFNGGNVNSDVGIGVRLDLPIGPVRIDYGFPLQKDEFSSGSGKFNFNIGYQF
jgi:outer membrane protein insertion porin family